MSSPSHFPLTAPLSMPLPAHHLSLARAERSSGLALELFRREPVLAGAALLLALALLPTVLALGLDTRTTNGVNVWIKVVKFEIALAVYLATLAWFAGWVQPQALQTRAYRGFRAVVLFCVASEIAWIGGAAANGVPSHFNVASPLMAALYPLMGLFAVTLTAMTLMIARALWRMPAPGVAPVLRSSAILGLVVTFIATVIVAGAMAGGTAHWVGAAPSDAGGLALMGWSRDGGDLRVAHFFATHAMHFIPAFGYVLAGLGRAEFTRPVQIFALTYVVLIAYTFIEALAGRPFLPML